MLRLLLRQMAAGRKLSLASNEVEEAPDGAGHVTQGFWAAAGRAVWAVRSHSREGLCPARLLVGGWESRRWLTSEALWGRKGLTGWL